MSAHSGGESATMGSPANDARESKLRELVLIDMHTYIHNDREREEGVENEDGLGLSRDDGGDRGNDSERDGVGEDSGGYFGLGALGGGGMGGREQQR